ncbi:peptidoglycan DD-metalloendopeptidase family protein [Leptobacterium flavescens]|uniref:Peptidoglycan DD-metalloendopeptidase family protein n=2 Tax=Leptobacterium flavescens TaxID=472055 RepID=A0A6P0UK10_9FLAO|nr:peptidoglycan DD-metalloendopeptidase family protein [Leptobacterium flavescens]
MNPYKSYSLKYPFNIDFDTIQYASPIDKKKVVTSRYGWRWGRAHRGIDIDLVTGDEVRAMLDGKVRFVGYNGGHGRTVVVRHANGLETVYAHLSKYKVKVNENVKMGQVLGKGGTTGNARGSHLHLEVRYKGVTINPEYLFDFNKDNSIRAKDIWITRNRVNPVNHVSTRKSKMPVYNTREDALNGVQKERVVYIIRKGDTLGKIARRHRLSITQLCRINSIRRNSILRIGQRLIIN